MTCDSYIPYEYETSVTFLVSHSYSYESCTINTTTYCCVVKMLTKIPGASTWYVLRVKSSALNLRTRLVVGSDPHSRPHTGRRVLAQSRACVSALGTIYSYIMVVFGCLFLATTYLAVTWFQCNVPIVDDTRTRTRGG